MNHSIESNIPDTMNDNQKQIPATIGITAIVGVVSLVSITLIAVFSPHNMSVAPWVVGGLSTMGIALGYFSSNRA